MELDRDVRTMQPGDYRRLINGSPIQPKTTQTAVQDVLCNLIGNALIGNSLPGGTNKIIGGLEDRKSNRYFFAVWNNTAANQSIYMYQNGGVTLVMRTNLFGWSQTDFVDMDIEGDILVFTNNGNDIKKINVAKAIAGGVYTPTAAEIALIKSPPLVPLTHALAYDNSVPNNFISGNYFQFFYRYIYEDYDYSVFSPASLVSNGWLQPSGTSVDYVITSNTSTAGGAGAFITNIGYINLGMRLLLVNQTTATENGIWVVGVSSLTRAVDFAAGTNSDVTVYVKFGFATGEVWRIKSTNVGTIAADKFRLEGPNYLTVTRSGSPPATVTQIDYAVRINGSNELIVYRQEKVGSFAGSHTFYNNSYLFTVPDADAFVWNDNVPLKSKSLKVFKNRLFLFNNTEGYTHDTTTVVGLSLTDVTPVYTAGESNTKAIKCAKSGGRYNVGVVFFDGGGRHSGVKCINSIAVPYDPNKNYKIHVDLTSIAADIPAWAVRRSIVCTKELTVSFFLSQTTQDIYHYSVGASGYVYSKDPSISTGTMIDIGALIKEKRGYTFQQGDRIKIYISSSVYIDTDILGQDGNFIYTRLLNELISLSTATGTNYPFQIYTPQKITQAPFFETGFTDVDGTAFDLDGDVEIGNHLRYTITPVYSSTDPLTNNYKVDLTLSVAGSPTSYLAFLEDMSVWERNFPQWVTQSGRSMVKSDSRQINKYTYIRWGQQYIQNSYVLGLNTFYALDEQALPIENGAGTRLAEAAEVLVAIHEIEAEAVYVGQGFVQVDNVNKFLTKTDSVIGDARKYLGGHGSIHPASVVARDGRVYYLDMRKGSIIRRSQDGLTAISDFGIKGYVGSFCELHNSLGAYSRIVAGWDPQYECYCISFFDTSLQSTNITFYWHEKSTSWVFCSEMYPEFMGALGQKQLAFLNGQLWEQTPDSNFNNFFGQQKSRTLEMEFSPLRSLEHIWDAIEIDAPSIYNTDGSNEVVVSLFNDLAGGVQTQINVKDFTQRASAWWSPFFRWMNDPNFSSTDNPAVRSKYGSERRIRGQSALLQITYNGTDQNPTKSVTIFYTPSMQSRP